MNYSLNAFMPMEGYRLAFNGEKDAPDYLRLPDSRAGAMSCLTGIAARKRVEEHRAIRISDLVRI